jgi:rubrerythrin
LRESREADAKMSPDYRSLEKEVEASSVEVINLKA